MVSFVDWPAPEPHPAGREAQQNEGIPMSGKNYNGIEMTCEEESEFRITGRVERIDKIRAGLAVEAPAPDGGYPDGNPKTVMGLKKPSTWNIPGTALFVMGAAFVDGARKYGRFNWRQHTVTTSVYCNAIQRHFQAFCDGEDNAEDSGVHHLGHVMACCAILIDAAVCGKLNDDRQDLGPVAKYLKDNTK